jgi:hypothetical protein
MKLRLNGTKLLEVFKKKKFLNFRLYANVSDSHPPIGNKTPANK